MSTITDLISQQLAGNGLAQLSQKLGMDEAQTGQAVSTAVPLLLSALSRNAASPEGASSLLSALDRDHDGSVLDDVAGFLGNSEAANGAGILNHLLGGQRDTVETGLARQLGMNAGTAGRLLETLAPLVMGALGKQQRAQGFDVTSLAGFLGGQTQSGDMLGVLTSLLDSDKDGSVIDDLGNLAGKLFGR